MKLADHNCCTGCMACVDVCNHDVLQPLLNANGYYEVNIAKPEACTSCGLCTRTCPVLNPLTPLHKCINSLAVWTSDSQLRKKSASGGAFSACATYVIDHGGVAYGAAIDGFQVEHRRAATHDELEPIFGSKYQHSKTAGIYRMVKQDLLSGKTVLFSGLSCQVAGLIRFLGKTDTTRLITIDTICGGLSTMLPMMNLERSGKYQSIVSFRDKDCGWRPTAFKYNLKMLTTDGVTESLKLDNPVLNTFSSKLLKRHNCLSCRFNGISRTADITIGDFWGDTSLPDEHYDGLSVALVRTQKALDLVTKCLRFKEVSIEAIQGGNPNLAGGHYPLVSLLPTRGRALQYLRASRFDKAWRYMSSSTFPGMMLRLAIKLSKLMD